jgi:hypothetical protein
MNPKKKRICVMKHPLTFVDIDDDADPIQAKLDWLKKYDNINKVVDFQQQRRERENVRFGKVYQKRRTK